MKEYSIKFKKIFIPYLFCLLGVVLGWSLLHWVFIILLDWLPFSDEAVEFFIPAGSAFLVVLIFMRKRIKLLKFKSDKGSDFLYFIMTTGIAVPAVIAQMYLSTATGKLTSLNVVTDMPKFPKTKYYTISNYYFDKVGASVYKRIQTSGKYDQNLDFYIYTITPIQNQASDTLKDYCNYWICKRYYKSISNRLSDDEKNKQYLEFLNATHEEYKKTPITFTYLEAIEHTRDTKYFRLALDEAYYASNVGKTVLLEGATEGFENRNGEKLSWVFIMACIALTGFGLLLLAYSLKSAAELTKEKRKADRLRIQGWKKRYAWILPHEKFLITPLLLYVNTAVYIGLVFVGAGFISFDYPELYQWGGVVRNAVLEGQWWRLFTAMFLHSGIMHLFNNMVSLFFIGVFLEGWLGKWRYLSLYLVCGLLSSTASIYWHENTLGVGASGAIFGLYGFILSLTLLKLFDPVQNKMLLTFAGIFVGVNLVYGLIGAVDNAAHLGGLFSGLLIGLVFSKTIRGIYEDAAS